MGIVEEKDVLRLGTLVQGSCWTLVRHFLYGVGRSEHYPYYKVFR